MFARCNPNITGLLQGENPEIFARIGVGCWKKWLSAYKSSNISDRGKIGPRLLEVEWVVIYALSIGAKINDLGWPWTVIMHSVSKHVRLSELTVKIWIRIDPYCQRQGCSPMTLVSANIRFVPIFEGVHWREDVRRRRSVESRENPCFQQSKTWIFTAFDAASSAR